VRLLSHLSYGVHPACEADVYLPPESRVDRRTTSPLVLYLHGGAWHIGNRTASEAPAKELAREGYVVVAPSYSQTNLSRDQLLSLLWLQTIIILLFALASGSLAQFLCMACIWAGLSGLLLLLWATTDKEEVRHPAHINDVARAVAWARLHAPEWQANPDHIHVVGHSAGGHLASLLVTNTSYAQRHGVPPEVFKSCCAISGVYSDKRLKQTRVGQSLLLNAFGDRHSYLDAFPLYHVTEATPPVLLLNGGSDLGLKRHTLDFHYHLKQHHVYSKVEYFNHRSHWDIAREWGLNEANRAVCETVLSFLREAEEYAQSQDTGSS